MFAENSNKGEVSTSVIAFNASQIYHLGLDLIYKLTMQQLLLVSQHFGNGNIFCPNCSF